MSKQNWSKVDSKTITTIQTMTLPYLKNLQLTVMFSKLERGI